MTSRKREVRRRIKRGRGSSDGWAVSGHRSSEVGLEALRWQRGSGNGQAVNWYGQVGGNKGRHTVGRQCEQEA